MGLDMHFGELAVGEFYSSALLLAFARRRVFFPFPNILRAKNFAILISEALIFKCLSDDFLFVHERSQE